MDVANHTSLWECEEARRRRILSRPSQSKCSGSVLINKNEDALIEVLVRLPDRDLHRCKCVSKFWHSHISSFTFLSYYNKFNNSLCNSTNNKFTSFLIAHTFDHKRDKIGRLKGILLTDSDSKSFIDSRNFFDLCIKYFIPAFKEPALQNLSHFHLQGISNQLLLIEVTFTRPQPWRVLYVINPITKQCTQLPPLKQPRQNLTGDLGFVYGHPSVGEFTVLNVGHTGNLRKFEDSNTPFFHIQVFSSSCDNWKVFNVPWPLGFQCSRFHDVCEVIFVKGCFYWLGSNGIIAYDPVNTPHQSTFINLPPGESFSPGQLRLAPTSQGKLGLYFHCDSEFLLWELLTVDDSNSSNSSNYMWSLIYHDSQCPSHVHCKMSYADGDKVYFVNSTRVDGTDRLSDCICLLDIKNGSFSPVFELPPLKEGGGLNLKQVGPFSMGSPS